MNPTNVISSSATMPKSAPAITRPIPRPCRLSRADLDALAKWIVVRKIPPRQRLADHRHGRSSLHVVRRELATFEDWDAHAVSQILKERIQRSKTPHIATHLP